MTCPLMPHQFHSLLALAFVPVEDVAETFEDFKEEIMEELLSICDHLDKNKGGKQRGRARNLELLSTRAWQSPKNQQHGRRMAS